MNLKRPLIAAAFFAVLLVLPAATTGAESGSNTSGESGKKSESAERPRSNENEQRRSDQTERRSDQPAESSERQNKQEDRRQDRQQNEDRPKNESEGDDNLEASLKDVKRERLNEKKKAFCEKNETKVDGVMTKVQQNGAKRLERITKVYGMVKDFYAKENLSIANYDQLVADVESAKAAAESANASVVEQPKFNCDSDGPKADIAEFRAKQKTKVTALNTYRESVKKLIQAVKAAEKADNSSEGGSDGSSN